MKKMICLFLTVVMMISLCACSAQKGEEKMTRMPASVEPFTTVHADGSAETPASAETTIPAETTAPAGPMTSEETPASASGETTAPAAMTSAPADSPVSEPEPFLPADTVRTLWDTFGLDKTAFEALHEAMDRGDIVVTKDSDIAAGRDRLLAFYEATRNGEPGGILVLNYYDLIGTRCGITYFKGADEKYPVAYLTRLSFDGEKYHYIVRPSGTQESEPENEFRFLLHLEGKYDPPAAPYLYEHFVLADDDTLTWKQIEWGILSSQFEDHIPHHTVASRLYRTASLPEGSYVPDREEQGYWYRLDGKETATMHFAKANLDSPRAAEIFAPQKGTQSLLSYWEYGRILWRAELPYSVDVSKPTGQGILIYGTQYSVESASPRLNYLDHYDTEGRLLWRWMEAATGAYRHLLAVGEKDGETVCVFRAGELYSSDPARKDHLEVWTMDAAGKRIGKYETPAPAGSIRAACVSGNDDIWPSVYLAVEDRDASWGEGKIYLVSEGSANAQPVVTFPRGMVPVGKTMAVQDIMEYDGFLYLSAYYCTEYEKKFNSSYRDEAADVIEWCYQKMESDMAHYSEEITLMVRDKYTAVLFRTPALTDGAALPGEFKGIWSRKGCLGGALGVNDQEEITWEINEIGPVIYSPATSFATLYSTCRVIQHFFAPWEPDSDHSSGGYMLLDKTYLYAR